MERSGSLGRVNVILKDERFGSALSDFRSRAESCILVDKTQAIVDFLTVKRPLHCILRPRRSGKSTLLTMFQTFFEDENPEDNQTKRNLFKDLKLKIYTHPTFMSHFAKYTVIYMDLSIVRASTDKEEFKANFSLRLRDEIMRHDDLGHFANVVDPTDLNLIEKMTGLQNSSGLVLETALLSLSRILHQSTGHEVLILVDEYDTPVNSAANQEMYSYAEQFLRRMFGTLLRKTQHIFGALLVGILRCQRTSFLSGVPDLQIYPLESKPLLYGDACLFNEDEVHRLFDHVKSRHPDLPFSFEQMKGFYGAYPGATEKLYNPWTICRAFESQRLAAHWNDSGPGYFLIKHLFNTGRRFQETLCALLGGNPVKLPFRGRIYLLSNSKFSESDLFGLLYYAGYLMEIRPKSFGVPNVEVQSAYVTWISRHTLSFSGIRPDASAVVNAALDGSVAKFRAAFRKCFVEEHFSVVRHRKSSDMNRLLILGVLAAARHISVDFRVLYRPGSSDLTLGFYDDHSKTAAIIVLALKTPLSKSSLGRAANHVLSHTNFEALGTQLSQNISSLRIFCIVLCGQDCSISGRIGS